LTRLACAAAPAWPAGQSFIIRIRILFLKTSQRDRRAAVRFETGEIR